MALQRVRRRAGAVRRLVHDDESVVAVADFPMNPGPWRTGGRANSIESVERRLAILLDTLLPSGTDFDRTIPSNAASRITICDA